MEKRKMITVGEFAYISDNFANISFCGFGWVKDGDDLTEKEYLELSKKFIEDVEVVHHEGFTQEIVITIFEGA